LGVETPPSHLKGQGPGLVLVNVLWVNTHTLVVRDTR
jgi:hypothetical protein